MRFHNADHGARIIREEIGGPILTGVGAKSQAQYLPGEECQVEDGCLPTPGDIAIRPLRESIECSTIRENVDLVCHGALPNLKPASKISS